MQSHSCAYGRTGKAGNSVDREIHPLPAGRPWQFTYNPVFRELGVGGGRPLVRAADYAPKAQRSAFIGTPVGKGS
jgi:hypothetical protein